MRRDQVGAHILLVEDDPSTQKIMSILLEYEGHQVTCASNGQAALRLLATKTPDLIITDYMMPEMNGEELIRRVRTDVACRRIPILLMSAHLPKSVDPTLADAFLKKSGDFELLLSTVRSLLVKRKGRLQPVG